MRRGRRARRARQPHGALFCANDHRALAALDVARRESALDVGRRISIVGFDDAPSAALSGVELTSFSQPLATMADRAVAGVLADPARLTVHETVAGDLVVRGSARLRSTGIVRAADGRRVWVDDTSGQKS